MASPQQEQVGQYRNPDGICAPPLVTTDLMLAQSQSRFEFPIHEFYGPALLVNAYHLSRRQLQQIGHQYLGILRAHVTPFFAQYHGDFSDMTQTQALAVSLKGFAILILDVFGNPSSLV